MAKQEQYPGSKAELDQYMRERTYPKRSKYYQDWRSRGGVDARGAKNKASFPSILTAAGPQAFEERTAAITNGSVEQLRKALAGTNVLNSAAVARSPNLTPELAQEVFRRHRGNSIVLSDLAENEVVPVEIINELIKYPDRTVSRAAMRNPVARNPHTAVAIREIFLQEFRVLKGEYQAARDSKRLFEISGLARQLHSLKNEWRDLERAFRQMPQDKYTQLASLMQQDFLDEEFV